MKSEYTFPVFDNFPTHKINSGFVGYLELERGEKELKKTFPTQKALAGKENSWLRERGFGNR